MDCSDFQGRQGEQSSLWCVVHHTIHGQEEESFLRGLEGK